MAVDTHVQEQTCLQQRAELVKMLVSFKHHLKSLVLLLYSTQKRIYDFILDIFWTLWQMFLKKKKKKFLDHGIKQRQESGNMLLQIWAETII